MNFVLDCNAFHLAMIFQLFLSTEFAHSINSFPLFLYIFNYLLPFKEHKEYHVLFGILFVVRNCLNLLPLLPFFASRKSALACFPFSKASPISANGRLHRDEPKQIICQLMHSLHTGW